MLAAVTAVSPPVYPAGDPRDLRSGPGLVLPLPVELFRLVFLDVDEILTFLLIAGTQVLLALNDVRPVSDVVADGHLLRAGPGVGDGALGLFHAAGSRACAGGRLNANEKNYLKKTKNCWCQLKIQYYCTTY